MQSEAAVRAFAALAHEARLEVYRLLVEGGPEGVPAGAIAETLGIAPPTLSFHLKELRNAGVVNCERDGRQRIYRPDFTVMRDLMGFLTENCCRGVSLSTKKK